MNRTAASVLVLVLVAGLALAGETTATILGNAAELEKQGTHPLLALREAALESAGDSPLPRKERRFLKKLKETETVPLAGIVCESGESATRGHEQQDGRCVSLTTSSKDTTKEEYLQMLRQRMTGEPQPSIRLGEQCFICADGSKPSLQLIAAGPRG